MEQEKVPVVHYDIRTKEGRIGLRHLWSDHISLIFLDKTGEPIDHAERFHAIILEEIINENLRHELEPLARIRRVHFLDTSMLFVHNDVWFRKFLLNTFHLETTQNTFHIWFEARKDGDYTFEREAEEDRKDKEINKLLSQLLNVGKQKEAAY